MVNVTKINKLFPTVVHEFQYIADDNLTKAIKNEDLETKIINHTVRQLIIIYKKEKNINL